MISPIDIRWEWFPVLPQWLLFRIENIMHNYHDDYLHFLVDYDNGDGDIYTVNGLSFDSINALCEDPQYGWSEGSLDDIFPGPYSTSGYLWPEQYWEKGKIPIGPQDYELYITAQVWAYRVGQIYATLIVQTFIRAFEFGHYGRKKED